MTDYLKTPILLIIYNRIDTTQAVFDEIRKSKPEKLFIAADGPKAGNKEDYNKCILTRDILNKVDWECTVFKRFNNENLGLRNHISSSIGWFFENNESGIILEDDCLPDQSFFYFCQELLDYHKDDKEIMHISGVNFQNSILRGDGSYYYSKIFTHCWGWASWRRAWKYYDVNIPSFPEFNNSQTIKNLYDNEIFQQFWLNTFQSAYNGFSSWNYQLSYTMFVNAGLSIIPNVNLVSNIGFRDDAVHTKNQTSKLANLKRQQIKEIIHPSCKEANKEADYYTLENFFGISLTK